MKAGELYQLIGDRSADDDLVVVINRDGGTIYDIKDVVRESDPDSTGSTLFLKVVEL